MKVIHRSKVRPWPRRAPTLPGKLQDPGSLLPGFFLSLERMIGRQAHQLNFCQWRRLRRRALRAQHEGLREVCGLIAIDDQKNIELCFLRNESPTACAFEMGSRSMQGARAQIRHRGLEYIGMFHSHPISEAICSKSDIRWAVGNSMILIYDVCGTNARLWKITCRGGRKLPVEQPIGIQRSLKSVE
jgi:proteasome lid subunit RPN8/RPN11